MPQPVSGNVIQGHARGETLRALREALRGWERTWRGADRRRIPSGCEALDRLLPAHGLAPGTLVEWLGSGPGSGATVLALVAAREASRERGPLVVVDRQRTFYPPAAQRWGIDLGSLIVVRPRREQDEQWAMDQVLRSAQVAAVLAWPERLDARTFRRWQLAVETGGGLGLLVRPLSARAQPSWADVRWLVRAQTPSSDTRGWRLHVELLRARGGPSQGKVDLEIDEPQGTIHESHPWQLAAQEMTRTRWNGFQDHHHGRCG
jgi:protein ImuA